MKTCLKLLRQRHAELHWKQRELLHTIGIGVATIFVVSFGYVLYILWPAQASTAALQIARANTSIQIVETRSAYEVYPQNTEGEITAYTKAIVLYPGGAVPAKSYIYNASAIVEQTQVPVFIMKMPFNMAILNIDAADAVINNHPEVQEWYIAGHSLGGVAACRFLQTNMDSLDGIILLASYCDVDVQAYTGAVLEIRANNDKILNAESANEAFANLPTIDITTEVIPGMNHAQFGSYGKQSGDGAKTISNQSAAMAVANTISDWLDERSKNEPVK